jgi:large conductance mechanosensitive channel
MFKEFKEFAMRGNVVDMAVGIVIGAAFGKIVSTFVANVLMPPIGLVLGGVDFSNIAITLKDKTADTEAVTIGIGLFINAMIDFTIVAFALFMVVKAMNSLKKEAPPEVPAAPPAELVLLTEIRDALKNR